MTNRASGPETNQVPNFPSPTAQQPRQSLSMHDGVEVWHDCCSCEAEPYWLNLMEHADEAPSKER
ncbi:hypothetical protein [endosymbiont of Ridgeia piscesae]|jgi:hypothetical protein|uniref:Uncharacterized protein n=1 Tax=endosymbiont of Ridgeia piscesae TaxID=54398 RepID=A0A0T5YXJ4_9GAMM|nr:hypothetical protein [endosymbiont of Ridgeia piscesae]KRT55304.1 hypothetical protein Ga0074115_11662 [endosymbiont of Ridgeia piscesae]KRT60050.1 hypothetical protein Ga0076813_164715 [endosymbiont of Ridgeia piscesae]